MESILSYILSGIFIILALIHFNWGLGSQWALDETLPTNPEGKRLFNPGKLECWAVGLGLSYFALVYLQELAFFNLIPPRMQYYSLWFIPIIFAIRAIGDFRYVGFFKSYKDSPFGKMDSRLFSPLCGLLSLFGFYILWA